MSDITWVPAADGDSDCRPVFSPDGRSLLFERSSHDGSTVLYVYVIGTSAATRFIADPPYELLAQTRADWAADRTVAFTGDLSGCNGFLWLCNSSGGNVRRLPRTFGMCCSSWFPDSQRIAVMNCNDGQPHTTVINRCGATVIERRTPASIYACAPSIRRQYPQLIAVGARASVPPYNKNDTHIAVSADPSCARPIEQPAQQGRAPSWSPNGKYLAFESSRGGAGNAIYIATMKGAVASSVMQLTDASLNAQQPKFSADGKRIAFSAQRTPGSKAFSIGTMRFTVG